MNWDHLRYFIAAAELGSFSTAARALKANTATVSRHIAALEDELGTQLFKRQRSGLSPTAAAERLVERVKRIEREIFALGHDFDLEDHGLHGRVVVTATETLAVPLLIPALGGLLKEQPGLAVTLKTDYRSLNLSRREADIALRMARPQGANLTIRKVGQLKFGLYAHHNYLAAMPALESEADLTKHKILDWAEDYLMVPVIGWLRRRTKRDEARFNADSAFARVAAAKAGIGVAVLPHVIAKDYPELVRVAPAIKIPSADLWLVAHKEMAAVPRVRAVMDCITKTLEGNPTLCCD